MKVLLSTNSVPLTFAAVNAMRRAGADFDELDSTVRALSAALHAAQVYSLNEGSSPPSEDVNARMMRKRIENSASDCDVFVYAAEDINMKTMPGYVQYAIAVFQNLARPILFYTLSPELPSIASVFGVQFFGATYFRHINSGEDFASKLYIDLSEITGGKEPDNAPKLIVLPECAPSDFAALIANPAILRNSQPRFFEKVIAELLVADGWEVKTVPRINAPGPDIIAVSYKLLGNRPVLMVVECKRWREDRPVDIDIVRKVMYWVDIEYRATFGMIATTSRFTKDAIEEAAKHEWRLHLQDYDRLLRTLAEHLPGSV